MRHMRRIALAFATAGLLLTGLGAASSAVPAMAASKITIQTYSASAYQYTKYCDGSTCNLKQSTHLHGPAGRAKLVLRHLLPRGTEVPG